MTWRSRPNLPELDATKIPTAIDIAWAAGIFEGEGTCRMCGRGKRSLAAHVPQKEPEILYKLRDLFGGSVCGPARSNVCCHWNICGDRCRIFMAQIYPFLSSRRRAQVDATDALVYLGGKRPEELTQEDLVLHLAAFYEEQRANTWYGKNRNAIRRQHYAKKKQDPEWYANHLAVNRRWLAKRKAELQSGNPLLFE